MKALTVLVLVFSLVISMSAAPSTYQLQQDLKALQDRVTALENTVKTLQQWQSTMNQSMTAINDIIKTLQDQVKALQTQIADHEQRLKKLETTSGGGTTPPPPPPPMVTECSDGTAITAGRVTGPIVLKTAAAKYCVQGGDIHADLTAFSVQASKVTLDCGGHFIFYGEQKPYTDTPETAVNSSGATYQTGNDRVYGVLGTACYGGGEMAYGTNPCGGSFDDFTLLHCKIMQKGGGPFSDNVHLGQGSGARFTSINNEFYPNGNSAHAIRTTYRGGHKIHDNVGVSTVMKIQSRHQLDGVFFKIGEGKDVTTPNEIYNNVLSGSPQGGILDTVPSSKIYNNTIRLNSYYTNDFCIYGWGPLQSITGNTCDTTQGEDSGRGVQLNSPDIVVSGNKITVRELPRNAEYSGCEAGGVYGVQTENATLRANIFDNDITVVVDKCAGAGMRLSGGNTTTMANNRVGPNRIRVLRQFADSAHAYLFSFRGCYGCTVEDDADPAKRKELVADSYFFHDITQDKVEPQSVIFLKNLTVTKGPLPASDFKAWNLDNYGGISTTINATGINFVGVTGSEFRSFAIGQPLSLMHKPFKVCLNQQSYAYNTTSSALQVDPYNLTAPQCQ